jgi:hypothetical protein
MSRRLGHNLDWLIRLRARISERINQSQVIPWSPDSTALLGDAEDGGLLGWRTKLVRRAAQNNQTWACIPQMQHGEALHPILAASDSEIALGVGPGQSTEDQHPTDAPGDDKITTDQLVSDHFQQ